MKSDKSIKMIVVRVVDAHMHSSWGIGPVKALMYT